MEKNDNDRRHSLPGDTEGNFQPKEGGPRWSAKLHLDETSGYDLVLFLDYVDYKTDDSGWMLELGINPDGSISGQITAHPGYDALAVFKCTQDTLTVWDNWGGAPHVITDSNEKKPASPYFGTRKDDSSLAASISTGRLEHWHGWQATDNRRPYGVGRFVVVLVPNEHKARVHLGSVDGPVFHEAATITQALQWAFDQGEELT